MVWLGLSARKASGSVVDYLAASRKLTLAPFVTSLVCTWYGGILGIGESVAYYGVGTWLFLGVPYYLFGAFYAIRLSGPVRGSSSLSIPEQIHSKFGSKSALVAAILMFFLAVPATHVLMLGTLVQSFSGIPLVVGMLVALLISSVFLWRGGILSDIRISVLTFISTYIGFAVILFSSMAKTPLSQVIRQLPEPMQKLDGGQGIPMLISFLILGAWTLADPGFHQRVISTESVATSRKGIWICFGCWMVFDLLTIGTGLFAFHFLKESPDIVTNHPLLIFPAFAEKTLGTGLKAVFFCGVVGTILTALVSYTLVAGASFGREILGRIVESPTEKQVVRFTQIGIIISCVVAFLLAQSIQSVVQLWYAWSGAVVGAVLIPFLYSCRTKTSLSQNSIITTSMIVSFVASCTWMIWARSTGNPNLSIAILRKDSGYSFILPSNTVAEPLKSLIASSQQFSIGTLLPGLLISFLILSFGRIFLSKAHQDE